MCKSAAVIFVKIKSFQIFEVPIKSEVFTLFTYFVFSQYQPSRLTELIQFQKYFLWFTKALQ